MTDPAQRAVDAAFRVHGQPAEFTPEGGSLVPVTIIPRQPDEITAAFGVGAAVESSIFDIRVTEVANPAAGDQIAFGGTDYKIKGKPLRKDDLRLIWTCITHAA